MKNFAKKFFPSFIKRKNITALSLIVAIGGISSVLAFGGATFARYRNLEDAKKNRRSAYEDEIRRLSGITTNLTAVPDPTADWKAYENQKYHFFVKYPKDWQNARESYAGKGENYLLKISFDEEGVSGASGGKGFDVFIYSAVKFPGPIGTDNLKEKTEDISSGECPRFYDITLGKKGYPAKEVNVSLDNPCFEETFFYSLTKGGYTYNIVPRQNKNKIILTGEDELRMAETYAQFYDVVSTLDLAPVGGVAQLPKKVFQQVAAAPQVRYTSGKKCAHPERKPSKSDTKGKHMDEDCCPDPDEWPDPSCAYSAKDLAIMISPPSAKKKK
jgi:hypothetical protein